MVNSQLSDTTMNLVCVSISGSTNEINLNIVIVNEIRTLFVAAVAVARARWYFGLYVYWAGY